MITLQAVELGVLGPLQVRQGGAPVAVPGAKPRAILTMLGLHDGSIVAADTLIELLWGEDPPRTAAKALQTHISSLRRALGDGFVLTAGAGWKLNTSETDASRYKLTTRIGRDAAAAGETSQAVARFEEALTLWRGTPELPDTRRGISEKTRWIEGHAALVEDRADALLATGRAAEIIGELEAAVADAPLRERRWGQLMLALYRAGRQGEALAAYQRARSLLADELGVDPGPELRRLETAIVAQDAALDIPVTQNLSTATRAVTFLLTDIEGSTAAWEADADAMAIALARHDELVEQVVTSRGGRLIKTRGEGDATFSVFDRPSASAAAAIELQDAICHEPWALREPMRIRVALHTGEAELRDGDYFGRAVNRAARLRSLAEGGQILCSGATAEMVIDSLSDDVLLIDLGMRQLKNLARPEHVFELRLEAPDEHRQEASPEAPIERPSLPAVLAGPGPFVGRGHELGQLSSVWQTTLAGGTNAALIAGEPGVGKTRLAGEWSRQAYEQGAVVLYGRCDEDLGAPYQPFAEALRSLVPCLGAKRLRGMRGIEALLALAPGLSDVLPDLATPTRADPDTERYALFDAVVALCELASASAPVVLILDDLHWAAKPTLLLLRHLLRFGDHARMQIVGTYRGTDLDRSHPLAAMLADLHRDGTANRLQLSGLDEDDVTAFVAEAGYDDEELGRALASVTGGNPFFLIEALRHVDESGGVWDPSTLPQGVRETVSRRLSRLSAETNTALAAAAVVGSRFAVDLVEQVVDMDLVDAFDEACKAGIIIEEPGGRYRFNHAIVRQSLLAELASVRRLRLHQRIAMTLETQPGADDELLAELAYHYFECAWAGNAAKAVDYCRRAADQAMARLAYEGAADLYDRALHALEEIDDELPDRDDQVADLLVARCEALLAAGDVTTATGAVAQLQRAAADSARLAAWATCFDGELSMLVHPERLDEIEMALAAAARKLAELNDAAGEAKAHTVRATCLARLGRVGDCEIALDDALTAARRAGEHRRVNAVLAGAPLAALWGPNPVPRAGGRCLDVVRLLRITTDSPAVEATSTRCQAVLEAFRGRAEAARRMIDSARRTVTELGLRHALLEVEQFAGIVELVADDAAAAEPHLRQAYNGFRRMGLDADTAETAALLGRACLVLDREAEADELCTESERLAGHALKPSIHWRTLRARLLSRRGDHDEARRIAEAAVAVAERTDALVDHGDACLSLATVLGAAGDTAESRAAAERAFHLYERKGAAALAERAHGVLGQRVQPVLPAPPEPTPRVEHTNACVRAGERVIAAIHRQDWDEIAQLYSPNALIESRRKIVGFTQFAADDWVRANRPLIESGTMRMNLVVIAVRGERLALSRLKINSADVSPGAPYDEFLVLYGIDEQGRFALQLWFDLEDIDAAIAELDAMHAKFEEEQPQARRLENAASQVAERFLSYFASCDLDAMAQLQADDISIDDRRPVVNAGIRRGRDAAVQDARANADVGAKKVASTVIATRGEHLVLCRARYSGNAEPPEMFHVDVLSIYEINADERIAAIVTFDPNDFQAAIAELDARYLAGEAAPYAHAWSVIMGAYAAVNRHEIAPTTPDFASIDHRQGTKFAPGDLIAYLRATWDLEQEDSTYVEAVHRLDNFGAVVTHVTRGSSKDGFDAEWREVFLLAVEGELLSRCELFAETDLDTALARFDLLSRPIVRLENAASQVYERIRACFAARDWAAMANLTAQDMIDDDRRHMVNADIRRGRDAHIANSRAVAELGSENIGATIIATRGELLALCRSCIFMRDNHIEFLSVVEIDTDEQFAAHLAFDLDDFDAAFAELDARYLAGEAADYAHTWSVIASAIAAHNRREIAATTSDVVTIDHRRGAAFAPGEGIDYLRAGWDLDQTLNIYIETAHRLSDRGAVFSWTGQGTSHEGFAAEWRGVNLMMVDGEMVARSEVFDEKELDTALAKFDQLARPAPPLENTASRVDTRFQACFAARDWDAMAEMVSEGFSIEDRRRVVNMGNLQGRDAELGVHSYAVVGSEHVTSTVIATRGKRLALSHYRFSEREQRPDAFRIDILAVVEIDADDRMAAVVVFDVDNFDAAIAELDARYLAGEAAAHGQAWSLLTATYAAINRREMPSVTAKWRSIDHRRGTTFAPGDLIAYVRAAWDLAQDGGTYIEAVHRLGGLGAVITHVTRGTTQDGFDAEWREVILLTFEGDLIDRCEMFDEEDLNAATGEFDELSRPALKNAASQAYQRVCEYLAARDWDAVANLSAENVSIDDRRRVVNAGLRTDRGSAIQDVQAAAEIGLNYKLLNTKAIRGSRLALVTVRGSGRDPETIANDALNIVEIDADGRIAADVVFDLDDVDAAFDELDARYLAGEGAAHAHIWSVISGSYAGFNRRELPSATPDWVNIDHRRPGIIEEGNLNASLVSLWNLIPDVKFRVEAVYRLNDLGAVCSHVAQGVSRDGFHAEWRGIEVQTVDGALINRCEIFDTTDLDAALARFNELSRQPRRLENAASQAYERIYAHFAVRDWEAIRQMTADAFFIDDRRRVVNAGVRRGRHVAIEDLKAVADIGFTVTMVGVMAVRGARLALTRTRGSGRDPEGIQDDALNVVEIDADGRIAAIVVFDPEDIDAAFAGLDARYLAGEAAPYASTWSVIAGIQSAVNRRELPPMTPDPGYIDHRPLVSVDGADLAASIRAIFEIHSEYRVYVEAVHRLDELGAVYTQAHTGTSHDGVDAEWRMVNLQTVEGHLLSRCEIFDETQLDTALARFDELHQRALRLENAASQAYERFRRYFAARDWAAMAELLTDDASVDDHRRVVNAETRHGRDIEIANMRAFADIGAKTSTATIIATRGDRLVLCRTCISSEDQQAGGFRIEFLNIVEITAEQRILKRVAYDLDDTDAAFDELDARYLAGEAAAYSHTWALVTRAYKALNRRQLPDTSADWVNIDHRRLAPIGDGELGAYLLATWELSPQSSIRIEAVHRLSKVGAVVTQVVEGTSQLGFDAEWRTVDLSIYERDKISRSELFDEANLDAALARFDELQPTAPRLENAASRLYDRCNSYLAAGDWEAIAELVADDICTDDRRRLVGSGIRRGRDAQASNLRAIVNVGVKNLESVVIATRGERIALARTRGSGGGQRPEAFSVEMLNIIEIGADNRVVAAVQFDPDDFDAAIAELDSRYLAGEAAAHAHTWMTMTQVQAAYNRHELPPTTEDLVNVDHRRGRAFAPGDAVAFIGATWNVVPDVKGRIEAVHRLTNFGAVVTEVMTGISQSGFDAEWREIGLFAFDGDLVCRFELFDEADLDNALARFDELDRP